MKITAEHITIKNIAYPCIMQNVSRPDLLVLFRGDGDGTVLESITDAYPVGHHSETWQMGEFKPFTGIITIDCTE